MNLKNKIGLVAILGAGWWFYQRGGFVALKTISEGLDSGISKGADYYVDKSMKLSEAKLAYETDGLTGYWRSLLTFFDDPVEEFNEFQRRRELDGKSFKYYDD